MITLPPRPPKDYGIEEITRMLQSSQQLTPYDRPRITQTTIGKQAVPIPYKDDETPDLSKVPRRKPQSKILEKMMLKERYSWVMKPGNEDFFIHDMYKKYTVSSGNYDPRYMHKEKIFNRSYQYELDCLEEERQEKFYKKIERDEREFEENYLKLVKKQQAKEPPAIYIHPCKQEPPFWWQTSLEEGKAKKEEDVKTETLPETPLRWIEEPNLTAFVKDDPCQRKKDMLLIGRPFKHDACIWYLKTYPPPILLFRKPKRFA